MRRLGCWFGGLLAVLVAASAQAQAQPSPGQAARRDATFEPQKWAVVIGIGKYRDPKIRPLQYAAADANAVYQFLIDPKGGGYPPSHVRLLVDEQATQFALRSALGTTLARRAVRGDTVFIYYAGHGASEIDLSNREPDGYAKYLIPHDARADDLFASAINMAEVETFFSRIKADTIVLALDTCYSGAGAGRGFANLPPGSRDIALKGDFLDRLAQGRGRAIITAADANEVALELAELGHGLFTYHLLEGLRGRADPQGKGYVTLQDVYQYVYDRVARQSRQVGGNQNPKLTAQAVGDIVLAGQPSAAVAAILPRPEILRPTIREEARQDLGSLALSANVEGIELFLGDQRLGETKLGRALVVENLAAGTYRLRARKLGHRDWEREVRVAARQRTEVLVDIEPLGRSGPTVGGATGPAPADAGDDAQRRWQGAALWQMQIVNEQKARCLAEAGRARATYEAALRQGKKRDADTFARILKEKTGCARAAEQELFALQALLTQGPPAATTSEPVQPRYERELGLLFGALQRVSAWLTERDSVRYETFTGQVDAFRRDLDGFKGRYARLLTDGANAKFVGMLLEASDGLIASAAAWKREAAAEKEAARLRAELDTAAQRALAERSVIDRTMWDRGRQQLDRAIEARDGARQERARQWDTALRLVREASAIAPANVQTSTR